MSLDPPGTIEGIRLWKRFRDDENRWSVSQQLRYARAKRKGNTDAFWRWALRDINIKVAPGEAVGLVGPNGSGKSTLLKLLTRVMHPNFGTVNVVGRVGALIEVRAGLHTDLTGRENVYLYGSILGLTRREIEKRFDAIVEFAELGDAMDRQLKFYSSGMQMRLGFSVACHLDPDILLVDEVLAVGDASFQQRCHDRMREVLTNGTSLVLVSHDLAAVEATCGRCLLLHDGVLRGDGPIRDVLGSYREWIEATAAASETVDGKIRLLKATAIGEDGGSPRSDGPLDLTLVFENPEPSQRASVFVGISEGPATPVFVVRRNLILGSGETEVRAHFRHLPLPNGRFFIWLGVFGQRWDELLPWHPATFVDVIGPKLVKAPRGVVRLSAVHVETDWDEQRR
jgi:ABC-2 type transport system ATP-binding protein